MLTHSRSLLFVSVWLSGVLLFIKTSLVTSYNPVYLYDVTAGVGRFNASSVPEYLEFLQSLTPEYNKTVVPYSIYSMVQGLVVNKMHSVASPSVNCGDRVCDSYLFTGGLIMTTPLPPTSFPEYPVIQVHDAPTTQLEFSRGLEGNDSFEDGDCSVFGAEGYLIAIRLCVAHSRADAGAITAGMPFGRFSVLNNGLIYAYKRYNRPLRLPQWNKRRELSQRQQSLPQYHHDLLCVQPNS